MLTSYRKIQEFPRSPYVVHKAKCGRSFPLGEKRTGANCCDSCCPVELQLHAERGRLGCRVRDAIANQSKITCTCTCGRGPGLRYLIMFCRKGKVGNYPSIEHGRIVACHWRVVSRSFPTRFMQEAIPARQNRMRWGTLT